MVYTERADKCISKNEPSNSSSNCKPSSNGHSGHSGESKSSATKSQQSGNTGAWSSQATNAEKWKYNNMIKNNREQFNGMHFS